MYIYTILGASEDRASVDGFKVGLLFSKSSVKLLIDTYMYVDVSSFKYLYVYLWTYVYIDE